MVCPKYKRIVKFNCFDLIYPLWKYKKVELVFKKSFLCLDIHMYNLVFVMHFGPLFAKPCGLYKKVSILSSLVGIDKRAFVPDGIMV